MTTRTIDPETGEITSNPFEPSRYLTSIKGQRYLEVKWRIAWLRAEHPDAILSTDLHSHENGRAIFSAHVQIPGGGAATGWGSSTVDEFADGYIEKAETKAIGRALAALGYGTQFADDFSDGPTTGSYSDAPVGGQPGGGYQGGGTRGGAGGGEPATSAQKSMIQYKARGTQMDPEALARLITDRFGKGFNELTKREASALIDELGSVPGQTQPNGPRR